MDDLYGYNGKEVFHDPPRSRSAHLQILKVLTLIGFIACLVGMIGCLIGGISLIAAIIIAASGASAYLSNEDSTSFSIGVLLFVLSFIFTYATELAEAQAPAAYDITTDHGDGPESL